MNSKTSKSYIYFWDFNTLSTYDKYQRLNQVVKFNLKKYFRVYKDESTIMAPKYWIWFTLLLCFQTFASQSLFRPINGISICTILSLKFLSLKFRDWRDLRYHLGQPIVNFIITNKQAFSLMVELTKFTLDFKIAFNYKLNTMSHRKFQLILTLLNSLFFNTFFLQVIGHWKHINTYLPCFYWQIWNINIILWFLIF